MSKTEVLDDIISGLDPEDVPVEYIIMARIVDQNGIERIIRDPAEIEQVLRGPHASAAREARVILDAKRIKRAIIGEITAIYDEVNRILGRSPD